jgi:hypothetical protein
MVTPGLCSSVTPSGLGARGCGTAESIRPGTGTKGHDAKRHLRAGQQPRGERPAARPGRGTGRRQRGTAGSGWPAARTGCYRPRLRAARDRGLAGQASRTSGPGRRPGRRPRARRHGPPGSPPGKGSAAWKSSPLMLAAPDCRRVLSTWCTPAPCWSTSPTQPASRPKWCGCPGLAAGSLPWSPTPSTRCVIRRSPPFGRLCEIFTVAFRRNGADPWIGRRVTELFRQAGLEDAAVEARAQMYPPVTPAGPSAWTWCVPCARRCWRWGWPALRNLTSWNRSPRAPHRPRHGSDVWPALPHLGPQTRSYTARAHTNSVAAVAALKRRCRDPAECGAQPVL